MPEIPSYYMAEPSANAEYILYKVLDSKGNDISSGCTVTAENSGNVFQTSYDGTCFKLIGINSGVSLEYRVTARCQGYSDGSRNLWSSCGGKVDIFTITLYESSISGQCERLMKAKSDIRNAVNSNLGGGAVINLRNRHHRHICRHDIQNRMRGRSQHEMGGMSRFLISKYIPQI